MRMNEPREPHAAADVVVVGSFNVDHVWRSQQFPSPGETRLGSFSSGPGGKGFNQAIACVRQGVSTLFVGALGADLLGDGAMALAQTNGLQAAWLRLIDQPTGTAAILLDAQGQNLIVVGPGANAAMTVEHVRAQATSIERARVLLTQQEIYPQACLEAMRIARRSQTLTVHNPAPMSPDTDCNALLELTDVLTPNESEFASLLAQRGDRVDADSLAAMDDGLLQLLCLKLPVDTVVLTLGGAGVAVSHREPNRWRDQQAFYRQPAAAAKVIDTTGAGDAFNGALVAALSRSADGPMSEAVLNAVRVAALAVERSGAALAMPTAEDVRQRFG